MVINLTAVTLGQLVLPLGDPAGFGLFAVTAIAVTIALVPIALTTTVAPQPIRQVRLRLRRLYQMSPVAGGEVEGVTETEQARVAEGDVVAHGEDGQHHDAGDVSVVVGGQQPVEREEEREDGEVERPGPHSAAGAAPSSRSISSSKARFLPAMKRR
jgi:hypothetical protein